MRWEPGGISGNIEDRRGGGGGGGGFGMIPFGGRGGLGLGGLVIILLLSFVFGQDFLSMFLGGGGVAPTTARVGAKPNDQVRNRQEEPMVQFMSFVLDDAQNTWRQKLGPRYRDAKLVLFRDATQTACGFGEAATGPFYCPPDQRVYIDLAFYEELSRRFGAPGDFAQAYVLAHEIGHHVQNLLGVERQVRGLQRSNPGAANQLSVRMELQADCFAGIWGNSAAQRGRLEAGDLEEGLGAAAAVGDDHIQKMARGRVSPESFTHGSSRQRVDWFRRGFESGDVGSCDTFQGLTR